MGTPFVFPNLPSQMIEEESEEERMRRELAALAAQAARDAMRSSGPSDYIPLSPEMKLRGAPEPPDNENWKTPSKPSPPKEAKERRTKGQSLIRIEDPETGEVILEIKGALGEKERPVPSRTLTGGNLPMYGGAMRNQFAGGAGERPAPPRSLGLPMGRQADPFQAYEIPSIPVSMGETRGMTQPVNEFDYTPGVGGVLQRRDVVDPQRAAMAQAMAQMGLQRREQDIGMDQFGAQMGQTERRMILDTKLRGAQLELEQQKMQIEERLGSEDNVNRRLMYEKELALIGRQQDHYSRVRVDTAIDELMRTQEYAAHMDKLQKIKALNQTDSAAAMQQLHQLLAMVGGGGEPGGEVRTDLDAMMAD